MSQKPFRPNREDTENINVSNTSQRVALGGRINSVRVFNDGSAKVFIRFGDDEVEADSDTGIPVGPGVVEVFSPGATHVAAIAAASTGRVYFTPGIGS